MGGAYALFMSYHVVTRHADGRILWTLCALLLSLGFVLLLGIGAVLVVAALGWGGVLAYRRTPGVTYGLATLGFVAAALLAGWAIF